MLTLFHVRSGNLIASDPADGGDARCQVEGQTESFLQHMRLGVGAAAKDPDALLMFSGGQTRAPAGPRSEAASYWGVSAAADWFGEPAVKKRTVLEVRSTVK